MYFSSLAAAFVALLVLTHAQMFTDCPKKCLDKKWAAMDCANVIPAVKCKLEKCTRTNKQGRKRPGLKCVPEDVLGTATPPPSVRCPKMCKDKKWAAMDCDMLAPECTLKPCRRTNKAGQDRPGLKCVPQKGVAGTATPPPPGCPNMCKDKKWAAMDCASTIVPCKLEKCIRTNKQGQKKPGLKCVDA